MLMPAYFLALLMVLPILIESIPQAQHGGGSRKLECSNNSHCRVSSYCNSGSCVPCEAIGCGIGSSCRVTQFGKLLCQCPENTQGDPSIQCHPVALSVAGCNDHSHCGDDKLCVSTNCVDPCSLVQCGQRSRCSVRQREPQCLCPSFTQTNSLVLCLPVQGCVTDRQCSQNEQCQSGVCVDQCSSLRCGHGAFCRVIEGQPRCFCPPNTPGDPNVRCLSTQANGVDNRQNEFGQVGVSASGTQGVSHVGVNDNSNQGNVGHGDHQVQGGAGQGGHQVQGGAVQGGHQVQGGAGQGGHQVQGGAGQGGHQVQGGAVQGGHQGAAIHGSNQNGAAHSGNQEEVLNAGPKGCTEKSLCRDGEICEKGRCANPCDLIECGQGAICKLHPNNNAKCECPADTTGNPFEKCLPNQESTVDNTNKPSPETDKPATSVSVCRINSQCGNNKRCHSGSCIDPCVSVKCGKGAVCQVAQRQGRCVCPAGTVGNPREQCKTKAEIAASVTQKPASVTNPPASSSGTNSDIAFPNEQAPVKGTRLPGCETDPDPGECRGAFPRYYFNKAKDQCDCFLFGGCDIEGVRFTWQTFDECLNTCVPGNTTKGSGCKRVSVDEVTAFLEEQRRNRENNGR